MRGKGIYSSKFGVNESFHKNKQQKQNKNLTKLNEYGYDSKGKRLEYTVELGGQYGRNPLLVPNRFLRNRKRTSEVISSFVPLYVSELIQVMVQSMYLFIIIINGSLPCQTPSLFSVLFLFINCLLRH